ncbi:MAG: hypothetical protein WC861_06920 [Candidatus Micrarchaeia archaeon]|jgi:hypothetical protein
MGIPGNNNGLITLSPGKAMYAIKSANSTGFNFKVSAQILEDYRLMKSPWGGRRMDEGVLLQPFEQGVLVNRALWNAFYPLLGNAITYAYSDNVLVRNTVEGKDEIGKYLAQDSPQAAMDRLMRDEKCTVILNGCPMVISRQNDGKELLRFEVHQLAGADPLICNLFLESDSIGGSKNLVLAFSYTKGVEWQLLRKLGDAYSPEHLARLAENMGAAICFEKGDYSTDSEQFKDAVIVKIPVE